MLLTRPQRPPVPSLNAAGSRPAPRIAGLAAVLAVPMAVALQVLRRPTWYPILDLAQTELRVRDVGTRHPPLVGLVGRIGTLAQPGSHPGPISFWALWPFYRLLGATSWALQTASVSLHLVAIVLILWIAHRRGGIRLVLGVAAVLAVLVRAYGSATVTQPWNPYLPVLWWLVLILSVWSVICGDLPLLLLAVFAGSFCMQTHLPYVGLSLGLLAIAVGVAVPQAYLHRSDHLRAYLDRNDQRTLGEVARWTLLAAVLGFVLWLPPIIQQLTTSPGNLSIIRKELTHPPEAPIGARRGLELLLVHLNPWKLVARQTGATAGNLLPGLLLLAAWSIAVVVAWRLRHRLLLRLHLVLAVTLVLSAISMSRIHGLVWYYLVLWAWGTSALMVLTIGWTAALIVSSRMNSARREGAGKAGVAALVGVVILSTALFTVDATNAQEPAAKLSTILGQLVGQTARGLRQRPDGGRNGRYLVSWTDPISIGAQGFGLMNELERRGFRVGASANWSVAVTPHRVLDPANATAVVHLSVGADILAWRAKPGVEQVAYVDPRTPAQQSEYQRLRRKVFDELRAAGLSQLMPSVDENLFVALFNARLPKATHDRLSQMFALGLPAAVFLGPPNTT